MKTSHIHDEIGLECVIMSETAETQLNNRLKPSSRIYAAQVPFPIGKAVIEPEAGDVYRVRLFASPDSSPGSLARVPEQLKEQGYRQLFADAWQGRHVLVVRGLSFEAAKALPEFLQSQRLLSPDGADTPHENRNHLTAFRRDTLKWSGRMAMLASGAIAVAGLGQKDWNRVFTGLGFMTADSIVAVYGNGKGSIDFDGLFRDMHRHFLENGIELPDIATPETRRNAIGHVHRFIATHPVELNYSLGILGGISLIRSGLADFGRSHAGISRMTKGALGAGGSAAVVFLPEDKKRKEKLHHFGYYVSHPAEAPQALVDFILASPIRFKGLLSAFYTSLYLSDALEEGRKMKLWAQEQGGRYKPYDNMNLAALKSELAATVASPEMKALSSEAIGKAAAIEKGISELQRREKIAKTFFGGKVTPYLSALTGISYIAASLLAAASSKNRDASYEQAGEYERMYAMAAQTLMLLPASDRMSALTHIAAYLSTQDTVRNSEIKAPQIIAEVTERLGLMEKSPWLNPPGAAPHNHKKSAITIS